MKVLRFILLANTVVTASTLLFFAYRYIWFGFATVPEGRWGVASIIFILALSFYMLVNDIINDKL